MCQAYTLTNSNTVLSDHFGITVSPDYVPRYNARPAQLLPVITQLHPSQFSMFYWGTTPNWSKKKSIAEKLINVRADNLPDMPAYNAAFETRRCLIPANGFYGWKQISKKGQVPYRFVLDGELPFAFAGIWEEFENEKGAMVHTFAILTTEANELAQSTGGRMPVILEKDNYDLWLNSQSRDELNELLKPFSNGKMACYAVGNRVNDPEEDVAELIQPAPPADQFGNYSLFD